MSLDEQTCTRSQTDTSACETQPRHSARPRPRPPRVQWLACLEAGASPLADLKTGKQSEGGDGQRRRRGYREGGGALACPCSPPLSRTLSLSLLGQDGTAYTGRGRKHVMRGDDTATETHPHPRWLPSSLPAAASADYADRGEREPRIALRSARPPRPPLSLSLSLPLFFHFVCGWWDFNHVEGKRDRGEEEEEEEEGVSRLVLFSWCLLYKGGPLSLREFVLLSLLKSASPPSAPGGFPHAFTPSSPGSDSQWKWGVEALSCQHYWNDNDRAVA